MLLETKNIKKNDIIIYSRNSMDEDYNLRIIFKNDPKLYRRKITFNYTKELIIEYFPKNLIAYRLLTNYPDIIIPASKKYGCIILVNGEPEVIFTDPVFAVKIIEEYLEHNSNDQFRFKIQQVGYSTINKSGNSANYKEEFFHNLNIQQAINQNDEVYLDSLSINDEQSKLTGKQADEDKLDIIFIPEKLIGITNPLLNKVNDFPIDNNVKRESRLTDGNIVYSGKELHLEVLQNFRGSNNSNRKLSTVENVMKNINRKTQVEIRNDQYKYREHKIVENTLFEEKIKNEPRVNLTEDEESEYRELRKIHTAPSQNLRAVQIDEDDSEKFVDIGTPEKQNDDLFSQFLRNLQSESNFKIKKRNKLKQKGRESDIIHLFKSVSGKLIDPEQNVEKDI